MAEGNVNPKLWATVTILVAVLGCIGVIIAAAIGILPEMTKPELSPTPVPINITPSTTAPIPLVTPQSSGTANDEKCEWLQDNFPQSLEDVRITFNLPANSSNFRLVYEECGATATGFIFEGDTEFELQVPEGGCIDSYGGAFFSETPVENSFGGLRVYGGTVRATGVTYRAAWCSEHP